MKFSARESRAETGLKSMLSKTADIVIASVFFSAVFGIGIGRALQSRGPLTSTMVAVLIAMSIVAGLAFGFGAWFLYLRRHRL
jgi:hypothetical protein